MRLTYHGVQKMEQEKREDILNTSKKDKNVLTSQQRQLRKIKCTQYFQMRVLLH